MSIPDRWVAAPDHWSRLNTPIRAIVIHMAEGGNTVSWLTRDDNNSSHYVVEYDGEIVQMVNEARAAGSLKASSLRTTNDPPFTYLGERVIYGATAAKAALGAFWSNPNAAVIAIEVEGFASTGPNGKQRASLDRLVADIRSRRGPIPVLGHRDFQNYKACPGKHIPWPDYGGHAVRTAEEDIIVAPPLIVTKPEPAPGWATILPGDPHAAIQIADRDLFWLLPGTRVRVAFKGVLETPWAGHPSGVVYGIGDQLAVLLKEDVVFDPDPVLTQADIDAAVTADRAKARITYE
jgi:hypothetical protein